MLEATKAVFVRFRALLEIRQIWLVWAKKQKRFKFANLTQLNTKNRKHRLCGDSVDNGLERVISLFARQFWPVLGSDV